MRSTRDSRLLPIDETNEKVEDEAESTPIYRRTPDTREGAICETTNNIASVESHLAPHNGASRGKQQVQQQRGKAQDADLPERQKFD